jgi:drug/metabolite transporter (DMT)-like permease
MKTALYLILATVLWGLNFHLAKVMLHYSTPMIAGFLRYLFAVIALLAFAFKDMPPWALIKNNLGSLLFIGVVGLFGFNFFFFLGLKYTTAVNASLIGSLNPALTLLLSVIILKTKVSLSQLIGVVIAFIGVVLLITKGHFFNLFQTIFSKGDLYILSANVLFSLYHVYVKKQSGKIATMHLTVITNVLCFLMFTLILPFQDISAVTEYPQPFWWSVMGIGIFGTALAYYAWNKGVSLIGAAQAGIFMNVVPLTAVLFSFIFGEQLFAYHIISFVIIVTGLLLMQLQPGFFKKTKS